MIQVRFGQKNSTSSAFLFHALWHVSATSDDIPFVLHLVEAGREPGFEHMAGKRGNGEMGKTWRWMYEIYSGVTAF